MIIYLIILVYLAFMIWLGIMSSLKIRSNHDYFLAGKKGNFRQITGSLLATILGSSAVLGTADLAVTHGWAACWFLFCASAGLFLLIPTSNLVRKYGKFTLPQLIGDFYGKEAKNISSLIISIAWLGVIAAQIIGAAKILNGFTGLDYSIGVWGSGLVFIFYTVIGGQVSVLKTDLYQSVIIIAGVFITAVYLFFSGDIPSSPMTGNPFPFNKAFHPFDLLILLLTYSSTYVVGPDIYSRIFCSESKETARKSILWTALLLIPFSVCITFIGVYASYKFPELKVLQGSALIPVMNHVLPDWCIGLLIAALLSAVMSSGSTTLLTAAMIFSDLTQKDLERKNSLLVTKVIMCCIGLFSIFISLKLTSIIESLLLALAFFSGAFIVPTLAGLFKYSATKKQILWAITGGGCIALFGKIYSIYGNRNEGNLIIIVAFLFNALALFFFKPLLLIRKNKTVGSTPVESQE